MEKIILDLCGGTGAWSKPYREAGYDVRLITLPEDVRVYIPPKNKGGNPNFNHRDCGYKVPSLKDIGISQNNNTRW